MNCHAPNANTQLHATSTRLPSDLPSRVPAPLFACVVKVAAPVSPAPFDVRAAGDGTGGVMVVCGKPMPPGPMLMVSPLVTIDVVGSDPAVPSVKVLLPMTTMLDPISVTAIPSMVRTWVLAPPGGAMVVFAKPMPLGPMLIVCPSVTIEVTGSVPSVKVLPPITTIPDPISVTGIPSIITTWVSAPPSGAMVVSIKPIPLGPMLIVCPSATIDVVGSMPSVKVEPPTTTTLDPISVTGMPSMVKIWVSAPLGGAMVVSIKPMPPGPILIVCPSATIDVVGSMPSVKVEPPTTTTLDPISVTGIPSIIRTWVLASAGGVMVVCAKPMPPGPILIVSPPITIEVIGEVPIVKVLLPMTMMLDRISVIAIPSTVMTWVSGTLGSGEGVTRLSPTGPTLNVAPPKRTCVSLGPTTSVNVKPPSIKVSVDITPPRPRSAL
jgi:hypothetical protein